MSTGGELALWAGKTLGSGALTPVIGMGMSEILKLAGFPNADTKVLAKLDEISKQLDSMNRTLLSIEGQVNTLRGQLAVAQHEINTHTSEEANKANIAKLNRLFGSGTARGTGSLVALVASAKGGSPAQVAAFQAQVQQNVQPAIDGIRDGLTTTFAGDKSLLEQWTDLLIVKLRTAGRPHGDVDTARLNASYRLLENYFSQAVGAQIKGVAMLAGLHGLSAEPAAAIAQARADFYPTLEEELDLFLCCVERLVLSQLPAAQNPAWQTALGILVRAEVLNAALSQNMGSTPLDHHIEFSNAVSGGYGRVLCRPSTEIKLQTKDVWINETRIKTGFGTMSQRPSGLEVVDWLPSDTAFGQIKPGEGSPMLIVRTHHRSVQGAPPAFLGKSSYMKLPLHAYFPSRFIDLATLDFYPEGTAGNALRPFYANADMYVDWSQLHAPPKFTDKRKDPGFIRSTEGGRPGVLEITNAKEETRGNHILEAVPGEVRPPYAKSFTMVATAGSNGTKSELVQTVSAPMFATSGSEKLALLIRGEVLDSGYRVLMFPNMPKNSNRVEISMVGSDGTAVPLFNSDAAGMSQWDTGEPEIRKGLDLLVPISTAPGVRYSLQMKFTSNVQVHKTETRYSVNNSMSLWLQHIAVIRQAGAGIET